MANIYLINPKYQLDDNRAELCLSFLFIGTYLTKTGHNVKIIDAQIEPVPYTEIANEADIVGISVITSQLKDAIDISEKIKKLDNTIPIVWGGIHPTLYPQQCCEEQNVDFVIIEEGEESLRQLIDCVEGIKPVWEVKGLGYKIGEYKENKIPKPIDINLLYPLCWNLMKVEKYIRPKKLNNNFIGQRHLRIQGGRGCNFACKFCISPSLQNRCWRGVTAENMIEDMKFLEKNFRIDSIMIQDENFFCNKERLEQFCKLILKENINIKWGANSRVTYFNKKYINDDLLHLIERANCSYISFGIESGSQRVLDQVIGKGITIEESMNAVRRLRTTKIIPWCSFIVGMPGESENEIRRTLLLGYTLKKINENSYINMPQIYRPYPGCEMYQKAVNKGFAEPKTSQEWVSLMSSGGFVDIKKLVWLDKNLQKYVKNISEYSLISNVNPSNNFLKLCVDPFVSIATIRLKRNFFLFPIDRIIYFKVVKILTRVIKL